MALHAVYRFKTVCVCVYHFPPLNECHSICASQVRAPFNFSLFILSPLEFSSQYFVMWESLCAKSDWCCLRLLKGHPRPQSGFCHLLFLQEWKWGCEREKYNAFNGLYCFLTTCQLFSFPVNLVDKTSTEQFWKWRLIYDLFTVQAIIKKDSQPCFLPQKIQYVGEFLRMSLQQWQCNYIYIYIYIYICVYLYFLYFIYIFTTNNI